MEFECMTKAVTMKMETAFCVLRVLIISDG